jgi:predicted nucleotidyltransferase
MKKEFKNKLNKLGIVAVYLFGSVAIGRRSPMSDIDIGIIFRSVESLGSTKETYPYLYNFFTELYPSFCLDIVFLQSSPLTLQHDAIKNGKVIFDMDPMQRANYEAEVIKRYLDFKPVLKIFDEAFTLRHVYA